MKYRAVTFATQSGHQVDEPQASPERLLNMFVEQGVEERPLWIRSCPGATVKAAGNGWPVRRMIATENEVFFVAGGQLYRFDGTSSTSLGAVTDDINTTLAWNGTQLACVAGGLYFLYDGSTVTNIPGQAFSNMGSVSFMAGYFIFTEKDGGRFAVSHLYDGKTLDALDFASAEYRPDDIVVGVVDHAELWLFGTRTTEVWHNTGAAAFPFVRVPGASLESGCLQPNTIAHLDNTVFWIGTDLIVWRAEQYRPVRVSDHRVEAAVRSAHAAGERITAFAYGYEGHKFYALRFSGRPAWVYDAATQRWAERRSGQALAPWDAMGTARFRSAWLIGNDNGDIAEMDASGQEYGGILRREAQSRGLFMNGDRFRIPSADIRVTAGTGGTVMKQHSWDSGMTWALEEFRSVGQAGHYGTRLRFNRMGMGREFSLRLAVTDPVDFAIYGAGVLVK